MKREVKNILGMPLDEWSHKSCKAHFSVFPDEVTLYDIISKEQNKGHASELLNFAKGYYEGQCELPTDNIGGFLLHSFIY